VVFGGFLGGLGWFSGGPGPKVGQSSAGKVKSQQHGNKDDVKNSVSTGQKRVDGWGWLCFLGASMGGLNGSGGFGGFGWLGAPPSKS